MARKKYFYHSPEHQSRFFLFFIVAVTLVAAVVMIGHIKSLQPQSVVLSAVSGK